MTDRITPHDPFTAQTEFSDPEFGHHLVDVLTDVADLFDESVDADSLSTFLLAALSLAGSTSGSLRLDDSPGHPEISVCCRDGLLVTCDEQPSPIALRSRVSMRPETGRFRDAYHLTAIPLRTRGVVVGSLEMLTALHHPLTPSTIGMLQSIADLAAASINHIATITQASRLVTQLQTSLDHRIRIEQAKGILAERLGVSISHAMYELRNLARREQQPMSSIADIIIAGQDRQMPHGTTLS